MSSVVEALRPYMGPYLEVARVAINRKCEGMEPWQVAAFTFGGTMLSVWIWEFLFQPDEALSSRAKKTFFRFMRKIPMVQAKIDKELEGTIQAMKNSFNGALNGRDYIERLPGKGLTEEAVMKELQNYKEIEEIDWKGGRCSGVVYSGENDLTQLMAKVYGEFAWSNPLHPDVFPDIRKMEAEVVQMTCRMFNGSSSACGCMTAGGSESILMACLAYRNRAYDKGIKYPEMIVPHTVHAAFDKAASYFRIRMRVVPVDEVTRKVDIRAVKRAINRNTCMIAGSAPSYPHGVVDPIEELGQLGLKYDIPVHVDSCLGGFLVPFMDKAGFPLEPFDFRVPGVTSISADTHKFGYAPKGSSVIMYSHPSYRKFQYFVQPDWPGGIYASPTTAGSRSGAVIAVCWATMMYMGEDGYIDSTRKICSTVKHISDELRKIDGIFVYGEPKVTVIGFGSKVFNIYRLSDAMTAKGWNLNALQFPSSIHLCTTLLHTKPGVADQFISDVREAVAVIMKDPQADCGGQGAMYGMAQSIPDRSLVSDIAGYFFDAYYNTKIEKKAISNGTNGTAKANGVSK